MPSNSGGSGGTSNAGSAGQAGDTGGGFDCTSSARPGPLVEVEAGDFVMGCNAEVDDECDDDEQPMHTVSVSAFEIERTEVTQDAYTACVTDGACTPPSCAWDCDAPDLPANCLTIDQATMYCVWAGRRLPTEAEWEKAARGGEGQKYPWGNDAPTCELANMSGCGDVKLPAGSLPDGASPYGALDMAGNLVEMVTDWYDASYYEESPSADPTGPASGTRYGGRGGGYGSEALWMRASKRDWYDLDDMSVSLGFRCAR
jgi:sulfatase modifying factor 1